MFFDQNNVSFDEIIKSLKKFRNLGDDGLGLCSEHSDEALHRKFLKFWEKYKINPLMKNRQ